MNRHSGRDNKPRAIMMIVLAGLFFAFVEAMGGYIPPGTSPYQTVWARYAVHLVFMAAVFAPRFKGALVRTNRLKLQLFRSLLMVGMPVCYILALPLMPYKDVESIFWLSPLIVMGLAILMLHEIVHPMRWVMAGVAFAGVVILMHPDREVISLHALLPLGMAFCFALYNVLTRVLRSESTMVNLFYTAFGVFMVMIFFIPSFWQPLTLARLWPMVVIGLTGYSGLWALDKAYEAAAPSVLAPYIFTSVIWSVLLNFILFGHAPGGWWIPGVLLVIGSTAYLLYTDVWTRDGEMLPSSSRGQ